MSVKTYTPAEQGALLRSYARQGSFRAMALLGRKQYEIEELMIHRALSIGLEEYGDSAFHKSIADLDRESMEEAADLVMYEAVYSMRETGAIR